MASRSTRNLQRNGRLASQLMLAPFVIGMRLPMMAVEAGKGSHDGGAETARAVTEKAAAFAEGVAAAQMSMAGSAMRFWPDLLAGKTPSLLDGSAVTRAMQAGLRPAGRKVKANFSRLSRKTGGG